MSESIEPFYCKIIRSPKNILKINFSYCETTVMFDEDFPKTSKYYRYFIIRFYNRLDNEIMSIISCNLCKTLVYGVNLIED